MMLQLGAGLVAIWWCPLLVAASTASSVRRYVRPVVDAAVPAHLPGLSYREAA
jgi:hypothetical protein